MTKANATASLAAPPSKIAQLIVLLERNDGASLNEMVAATSWLPHTTRAALTGLRKKGYEIARTSVDKITRYTIVGRSAPDAE